MEHQNIVGKWW